jgi:Flp pilus assembly protein TadB
MTDQEVRLQVLHMALELHAKQGGSFKDILSGMSDFITFGQTYDANKISPKADAES